MPKGNLAPALCRLLFLITNPYMQGMFLLINGILLQYARSATAVTQSKYGGIQTQDNLGAGYSAGQKQKKHLPQHRHEYLCHACRSA